MIEAQWVVLPALFTGLYHWLRWVTDDQVARWEAEDPARTFASLAPYVLAKPRFLGLPSWWRRPPRRLTPVELDRIQRLTIQWRALQDQHESMRRQSLEPLFQMTADQTMVHAQLTQALASQQRRLTLVPEGTLANFGLLGALAPGQMIQYRPRTRIDPVTMLPAMPEMPEMPAFPPFPGGPT